MTDPCFLGKSGSAPALPTGDTWARKTVRAPIWDGPAQGRRLNVLGALAPEGDPPGLVWSEPAGTLDAAAFLAFVGRDVAALPAAPGDLPPGFRRARPCAIVLDNCAVHRSAPVQAAIPELEQVGVGFYYLPPYSLGLNRIEALWRHAKHEALPTRGYRTLDDLRVAVTAALNRHRTPRPARPGSTANVPLAA